MILPPWFSPFFSFQVTFRGTLPNTSPQVQEQVQAHESTTKILGQFDKKTESQQERSGSVEMQRIKFLVSKLDISGYNLILLNLMSNFKSHHRIRCMIEKLKAQQKKN